MTIGILSSFGTWLSSRTPILVEYAPYSYFICFGIGLLMCGAFLLVIRELIFTGTKKRTFIEFEVTQPNVIDITRKQANIADHATQRHVVVGNTGIQGNITEVFVVFDKPLWKPIVHITEKVAANPIIINTYSGRRCAFIMLSSSIAVGKFCIDFNDENNT